MISSLNGMDLLIGAFKLITTDLLDGRALSRVATLKHLFYDKFTAQTFEKHV